LIVLCSFLASVVALAQSPASALAADEKIWKYERNSIGKLVAFTAREHAAILFEVGYTESAPFAYAKDGKIERLSCDTPEPCLLRAAALSHDGTTVAYVGDSGSHSGRVVLYNLQTHESREFVRVGDTQLSWSWNDSEIAFRECPLRIGAECAIKAVKLQNGSIRTVAALDAYEGTTRRSIASSPLVGSIQWSHAGRFNLAEVENEVPTAQSGAYRVYYQTGLVENGVVTKFIPALCPSVSPIQDRFAYFLGNEVLEEDFDGTQRKLLAETPRSLLLFHESWRCPLVWSPDGKRLFFGTWISENGTDKVYLLDAKTKKCKLFLKKTSIQILDWR
jgi:Tol biopolymer transport system component